ncbi:fatty acid desaturase family protein [Specibacter cremeus]|uniref:fatty acid desaturase family protein n=1 Tax=Specibacter cremeus TaxID=1629051 RepID=UPI000F781035|nr:acyl-CoA desaturase [Specibacter cremeus]
MSTQTTGGPAPAPQVRPNRMVNGYVTLLKTVREAGLLRRRRRFYLTLFIVLLLLLAAAWTGFAVIGQSWFQLVIAAVLGVLFTQFGLLAHEAAHHQVFASRGANDWFGRLLGITLVGISFGYWNDKHSRHHTNPNTIGRDPDIKPGTIVFYPEAAAERHGLMAAVARRQGYLLFVILPFLGVALHVDSFKFLLRHARTEHRWLELGSITARLCLLLGIAFLYLPLGMACAFVAVQLGVFGFYMGASFAPNHKGMPILPANSRVDFLNRQVLTSRNIAGGSFIRTLLGGLNHQVEHHLFPDMPRPQLPAAAVIVREYCRENNIAYTETSLLGSYLIVVRYLNRVGLSAVDPFECPLAGQLRRR